MSESFYSIESFEIPNIKNDSFNTVARISDNSNTTSQTPTLDIIDESSNTSKSIWDYFKKMHNSLLGVSTSQSILDKFKLQASSKLAFILDIWTSISVKAYIGITIHFIDKSWSLQQRILNFVELEGAHSVPILDVPTYWNSTFHMIRCALNLKVIFEKILLTNEFSDLENIKLSQLDWVSLENIAAFLKRFAKLSTEMCSSFYLTISAARYSNSYDELNHYLKSSPEPSTTNVLEWWKIHKNRYPTLAIMVWNYLAILATSAPIKRIFSESGNIITPKCNQLGSGTIKALMCLKNLDVKLNSICLTEKIGGAEDYTKIRIIRVLRVIDSGKQDKLLVVDSNES
ncbi:3203_t:CDS:2, partial [Gigaspora margarita]